MSYNVQCILCNIIFKKITKYLLKQTSIFKHHFKYKSAYFYSDISICIYVTKYRQY